MVISKVSHTGIDRQKGYYNFHFGWGMVGYLGCHVWSWLSSFNGQGVTELYSSMTSGFFLGGGGGGRIKKTPKNDLWEANKRRTWLAIINFFWDRGFLITRRRDIITNDHGMLLTAGDKGIKILMGCRGCQIKSSVGYHWWSTFNRSFSFISP